jgi:hypothetical protein
VLTIIFFHHSSSSSLTLPKIFEILARALKKACDDRGRSSTVRYTALDYYVLDALTSEQKQPTSP